MTDEPLQVNLAVSLHAPNDALRSQLAPINDRYPIAEVMAAVRDYIARTHRRVTFEYALMNGINDMPSLAQRVGAAAARAAVPRQPDPAQPGGRVALSTLIAGARRRLPGNPATGRHPHDDARPPRD